MHTSFKYNRSFVTLLVLGVAACGGAEAGVADSAAAAPATLNVGPENVAVASQEMVSAGPRISGALAAEREATVRAEIPGPVLATLVDQGSRVARGAVMARIDDRTLRDQFLSARGGVTTAQGALNLATRELERFTKLKEAGAISDRDFESVKFNHDAATSQLADAQARLTLAQKQLSDAQVRAPFSGVVSARQINAGDVVSPGTAMFVVIDPASMRMEASVPAVHLAAVRVGAPVTFTVSGYPGQTFQGRISRVNPEADATTGQVKVVVTIPNARGGLVGGLFAEGRVAAERRSAITAPATAVSTRAGQSYVLRLQGGKAEQVLVEIGIRDEDTERVEFLKGVAAGDTLLVGAAQGITTGTPVKVSVPNDAKLSEKQP